jgi:hypothetical protein
VGFGGATVERSSFIAKGSLVQLLVSPYHRFISRAHTVRRRRVDFKLCLRTNVWFAAAQVLVEAITGEANRLLSLDLSVSSLGDGSQLPGRASITNSGQGSTLAHKQTPHTLTRVPCVG